MSYIWGAFGIFRGRRWENEVLKKEWNEKEEEEKQHPKSTYANDIAVSKGLC